MYTFNSNTIYHLKYVYVYTSESELLISGWKQKLNQPIVICVPNKYIQSYLVYTILKFITCFLMLPELDAVFIVIVVVIAQMQTTINSQTINWKRKFNRLPIKFGSARKRARECVKEVPIRFNADKFCILMCLKMLVFKLLWAELVELRHLKILHKNVRFVPKMYIVLKVTLISTIFNGKLQAKVRTELSRTENNRKMKMKHAHQHCAHKLQSAVIKFSAFMKYKSASLIHTLNFTLNRYSLIALLAFPSSSLSKSSISLKRLQISSDLCISWKRNWLKCSLLIILCTSERLYVKNSFTKISVLKNEV